MNLTTVRATTLTMMCVAHREPVVVRNMHEEGSMMYAVYRSLSLQGATKQTAEDRL